MSLPTNKQDLADWILRRLGAPVVNIEVTNEQLEDVIDEAVQFYHLYHYDGAERTYRTITLDPDTIQGNNRTTASLNPPMYDLANVGDYRIGDRVMVYKGDGRTPSKIFVRYDSDERIVKSFFELDSEGEWFLRDSDAIFAELEQKTDSDGFYVEYDSDIHEVQFTELSNWTKDKILEATGGLRIYSDPASSTNEFIFTDSDGKKVLYDSEAHTITTFTVNANGTLVDSDGVYVEFDSEKHTTVTYTQDSDGIYADSDGTMVLYDSEKHVSIIYQQNNAGHLVIENDTWTPFDSDVHGTYAYGVTDEFLVSDSEFNGLFIKDENDDNFYPTTNYYDNIISYPMYEFVVDGKYKTDSDSVLNISGVNYNISKDIKNFSIKGPGEDNYDSDGYGSLLLNSSFTNIRMNVQVGIGTSLFTVTLLDSEITAGYREPFAVGDVYYEGNVVDAGGEYFRRMLRDVEVYKRSWVPRQRYNTYTSVATRYSKSSSFDGDTYVQHKEYPRFYIRNQVLPGNRYSRLDSEIDRTAKTWDELWREEEVVLNEPKQNFDYSREGVIGIPIPENIIGINKVLRIDNFSGAGMWNYEYQYFLNNFDFFYGSGGSSSMPLTNYISQKSYIDLIDNMMNVQPAIRFNKNRNRLYIDTNWTRLENNAKSRTYRLMVECYEINDPEVYGDVYKDTWLKRYATALAKEQWGSNLKKHNNLVLPGGVQIDGQAIFNEGKEEREKLEEELKNNMSLEMDFIIG